MAKKQTRRSISVSRTTYERLKAFCETNHISMSQLVESRVNDFLVASDFSVPAGALPMTAPAAPAMAMPPSSLRPLAPRPMMPAVGPGKPLETRPQPAGASAAPVSPVAPAPASAPAVGAPQPPPPMTSAAARIAVDPPLPIIKQRQDTGAPKPAEKRPEQIFTF